MPKRCDPCFGSPSAGEFGSVGIDGLFVYGGRLFTHRLFRLTESSGHGIEPVDHDLEECKRSLGLLFGRLPRGVVWMESVVSGVADLVGHLANEFGKLVPA